VLELPLLRSTSKYFLSACVWCLLFAWLAAWAFDCFLSSHYTQTETRVLGLISVMNTIFTSIVFFSFATQSIHWTTVVFYFFFFYFEFGEIRDHHQRPRSRRRTSIIVLQYCTLLHEVHYTSRSRDPFTHIQSNGYVYVCGTSLRLPSSDVTACDMTDHRQACRSSSMFSPCDLFVDVLIVS
jgi:hypothetical protein